MTRVIFILRGLPGVGKTTTCMEITSRLIECQKNFVVLSRDHIRETIRYERRMEKWTFAKEDEEMVSERFRLQLYDNLRDDRNDWLIIDNTTLSISRVLEVIGAARRYEMETGQQKFMISMLEMGDEQSAIRKDKDIGIDTELRMRHEFARDKQEVLDACFAFGVSYFRCQAWNERNREERRQPLLLSTVEKAETTEYIVPFDEMIDVLLGQEF